MKSAVSILALLTMFGGLTPARAEIVPGPVPPPKNQALARDVMAELIAIKSIHEAGTAAVAAAIAARLRAGGFSDSELTVVGDPKFPKQVNVVVRLRGKGAGKPVLWIGHEDVVDARPEDWTLPPFKLTEKDGYFYGRGSADMKNADAAMLASMVRLKAEGFVPDRDIIAAFTADEEVGLEQDGVDWLLHHRPDLVDAGLIINPDNNSGEIDNGRRTSMDVETSQKTYVTFVLEVTNRGGHSSEPRPDNAIYALAQGLVRRPLSISPLLLSGLMIRPASTRSRRLCSSQSTPSCSRPTSSSAVKAAMMSRSGTKPSAFRRTILASMAASAFFMSADPRP